MAIRKEVLHRRGALASPATRRARRRARSDDARGARSRDAVGRARQSTVTYGLAISTETGNWKLELSDMKSWIFNSRAKSRWSPGRAKGSASRSRRRWRGGRDRSRSRRATRRRSARGVAHRARDRATVLAMPVDVRSADAIQTVGRQRPIDTFGGIDAADDQLRRAAGRSGALVRRCGVAGRGGPAAVQHAADGARRVPSMTGARRRRNPGLHVVVGEGADPEPRALDRAPRLGVGARQDARARARAGKIRVNQIIPGPHRYRPRPSPRRGQREEAGHLRRRGEGESDRGDPDRPVRRAPTSSAASARSCSRTRRRT